MALDERRKERIERLTAEFRKLLEEKFPDRGSTMEQIEQATEEVLREIGERIEDTATDQECRGYVGRSAICECGQSARYVRDYTKHLTSLHGERRIERAYYHCSRCGKGFCPADRVLGLDSGSTTIAVRARIARLAVLVPFGRCAVELEYLCGIRVSAKTVERVAEAIGGRIDEEARAFEDRVLSGLTNLPDAAPDRLYVTMDGAMLSVDEHWHECKVGAVYETKVGSNGEPIAKYIEHVATLGNCQRMGERLYCAAFARGVERAKEVVVVADGARWIWNQARDNFPGSIEIVDYYHATEHLAEIANAWYGFDSPRAEKWLLKRKRDLLEGRHERVVRSIRAWRPIEGEHIKLKSRNLGYFTCNKERMRYDKFAARGLHIGSGVVESCCKAIVQARLKQPGMRWTYDGAEAILQLRRMWLDNPHADFGRYAAMPA
jgi:hypothetical protein